MRIRAHGVSPSRSFLENCRELNAIKFTICAPAITQLAVEVKGDVPGRYPRRLPSGSVITGEASNCGLAPISSPSSLGGLLENLSAESIMAPTTSVTELILGSLREVLIRSAIVN